MTVTEIVKGIETRDAKETATGTTGTETGIATDGTLACHSLVIIHSVVADNYPYFLSQLEAGVGAVAITGNLRTASDAATCVFLAQVHSNIAHVLSLSLASTALALALTALTFSFPCSLTASLCLTRPSSFAPFAIPWWLFR
jgi:hypothetical protein